MGVGLGEGLTLAILGYLDGAPEARLRLINEAGTMTVHWRPWTVREVDSVALRWGVGDDGLQQGRRGIAG